MLALATLAAAPSDDGSLPLGIEAAERVQARNEGAAVDRLIDMTLTDRRGKVRERRARSFRSTDGDVRRTALFFLGPSSIRGTAFLTLDYAEPDSDDDQWLYLPALRRVRRVSASDRGSYFFGTDFTYDDIKTGGRVTVEDYTWRSVSREEIDGVSLLRLDATPVSNEVANELGYGRARFWIDEQTWMVRRAEFWDTNQNALKTIRFEDITQIEGIWTASRIEAANHKTGHRTRFDVSEVDYREELPESLFRQESLRRIPR